LADIEEYEAAIIRSCTKDNRDVQQTPA